MPVFDYQCQECKESFEVVVLPPDQPPTSCSTCGGSLRKLFTGRLGTQFVGWGFTRNDSLMPDGKRPGDFKKIRDKAAELFD